MIDENFIWEQGFWPEFCRIIDLSVFAYITLYMYFESTAIDIGNVFSSFN